MRAAAPLACALFALLSVLPPGEMAVPGTFFWKPRVRLEMNKPPEGPVMKTVGHDKTWKNIENGYVVIIDGYTLSTTVAALASYVVDLKPAFQHLSPALGPYYTNMYRWALRYLSLLPEWLGSRKYNYLTTHKVWKQRFFHMDKLVPQWLRNILFFVDERSWKDEEWELRKFNRHSLPHFGKYLRYPNKRWYWFESVDHEITVENMDITDNSVTDGGGWGKKIEGYG